MRRSFSPTRISGRGGGLAWAGDGKDHGGRGPLQADNPSDDGDEQPHQRERAPARRPRLTRLRAPAGRHNTTSLFPCHGRAADEHVPSQYGMSPWLWRASALCGHARIVGGHTASRAITLAVRRPFENPPPLASSSPPTPRGHVTSPPG